MQINMFTKFSLTLQGSIQAWSVFLALFLSFNVYATANNVFVSTEWLKQNQDKVTLIDMSQQAQYQKFHIEGALWMNYHWLIKPQNGLALSGGSEYITKILSQFGIKPDTHIVIYDDMGGLDASRLYWELNKLQHAKVNILDGGLVNWVLAGHKVTQATAKRPIKSNYPLPKHTLTDTLTANKAEVIAAIEDINTILLDTRSKEEYQGLPKEKRSGHIPSAIWFEWSNAFNMRNGFKQHNSAELTDYLATLGLQDKQQPIILYCNTAHRAARSFTMLKSLGYTDIKLYDGSMQEYEIDKTLPLQKLSSVNSATPLKES